MHEAERLCEKCCPPLSLLYVRGNIVSREFKEIGKSRSRTSVGTRDVEKTNFSVVCDLWLCAIRITNHKSCEKMVHLYISKKSLYPYSKVLFIHQMGLVLCIIGITFHVVLKALHPPKPPPQQLIPLTPVESHQKVPLLSDTDGEEHELFSR